MTLIPVRQLCGVAAVPSCRRNAGQWFRRHGIPVQTIASKGGPADAVELSDLPGPVRAAFLDREAEHLGLEPGTFDAAAHERLEDATPRMRARAEQAARVVRFIVSRVAVGLTQEAAFAAAREKFGAKGTSRATLLRLMKAVQGVDPVNFAPALLSDYSRSGRPRVPLSPEAWSYMLRQIGDAHEEWPLDAAYDEVARIAPAMGWHWPARGTIHAKWRALPASERWTLRHGAEKALKMLRQPVRRDRATLAPMQVWSLDSQPKNLWTVFPDGTKTRPWELRLVDVGSGKIVGKRFAKTENAADTHALIMQAVRQYGAPLMIYTDNSRAFASHLVAGRAKFKFRKRAKARPIALEPPGVCECLGIEVTFAKPRNGQAKYVERTFAELQARIDARPEFRGAHTGSHIDLKPEGPVKAVPLAVLEEITAREIAHHNAKVRRGGFAKGRSFDQIFRDGTTGKPKRMPAERQFRKAALFYKEVSVDRHGRFEVNGWTYGGPDTQDALLAWHRKGRILAGVDPNDMRAPAVAYDAQGRLISDRIEAIIEGDYLSLKGLREHKRFDKAARKAIAKADELTRLAGEALMEKARLAQAGATPQEPDMPPAKVVQPPFGGRLTDRPRPDAPAEKSVLTPELIRQFREKENRRWGE